MWSKIELSKHNSSVTVNFATFAIYETHNEIVNMCIKLLKNNYLEKTKTNLMELKIIFVGALS